MTPKRLYRSRTNRTITGVCGGIAQYFNIDPTIVRLIAIVATVFSAGIGGVIGYIVCTAVIPEEPM
jgi:phage shock protein PspC (stress-responsive transcriptional regulator)